MNMPFQNKARIAYLGARILDPATGYDALGDLLIDGNTIADFGTDIFKGGIAEDISKVDCKGLCIAPGLVDMRAFLPGANARHKETMVSAAQSAVAGGITTFVCAPDGDPVIDSMPLLDSLLKRGREINLATVLAYGAITRGLDGEHLAEMALLVGAGAVGFSDGRNSISSAAVLQRAMKYGKSLNGLILHTPQDRYLAAGGVMHQGLVASRLGLKGIPAIAESLIVARDIRLAQSTGARLHLCQISTAESVNLIRAAKAAGQQVTCDTAPPYFSLTDSAVEGYRTFAKLLPPLRSEADRQAVIKGLVDGTIDAVTSDHCPQDQDAKRQPFAQAAFGAVGFETLLPLLLQPVHDGVLSLNAALACVTSKPATLLHLRVGRIAKRQIADLVVFDPHQPWVVDAEKLVSKSKNTPFDGQPMTGRVKTTIKAGKVIYTAPPLPLMPG